MSRSHKPSVFQVGKIRDDGRTVAFEDPWGNLIQVETASQS